MGKYGTPKRDVPLPEDIPPWGDLTVDCAKSGVVEQGCGLLVVGSPGGGKTHFVRELVKELRSRKNHINIIVKTHASVANFGEGAETADHWVRQHVRAGHPTCDVLVVEEITQLEVQLWADITKASLLPSLPQFILCGDSLQFPTICEHWAGSPVPEGSL